MSFSDNVVSTAWNRAGGKCECTRKGCDHTGRCNKALNWGERGKETAGGWEAHHINRNGGDVLSNCEILCQDCHKNTQSFGN